MRTGAGRGSGSLSVRVDPASRTGGSAASPLGVTSLDWGAADGETDLEFALGALLEFTSEEESESD